MCGTVRKPFPYADQNQPVQTNMNSVRGIQAEDAALVAGVCVLLQKVQGACSNAQQERFMLTLLLGDRTPAA